MPVHTVRRVQGTIDPADHPYLQGAWTPLHEEVDATDLKVITGRVPTDIDGVYLRNTENPVFQAIGRYHPFDGDGMIHQIDFTATACCTWRRSGMGKSLTATDSYAPRAWPPRWRPGAPCGRA